MTTEPKHTMGAMNAARALCLPPEWTEAAATIDRETQLPALLAENERLREALREITEGKGAFSMDPLTHAENTIEDMKALARAALSATEKP